MRRTSKIFRVITGKGPRPLLIAAILAVQPIVATAATELSCDEIVKILIQTGQNPAISINPAKETVTIRTTRGFCTESIDAWSKRPALTAGAGKKPTPKPEPEIKPTPPVVAAPPPEPKNPAPSVVVTPPPEPREAAPPKTIVLTPEPKIISPLPLLEKPDGSLGCQYQLAEVWGSLTIKIEGIEHWLVRAFTMDLDGDRVTDNVNFLFKAKNGKSREFQYFGVAGEISGRGYPALKLRNDSVIGRLCFGQQTFEKPDFFGEKAEPTWIQVDKPDLAAEKDAREKGVVYVSPSKKKQAKAKAEAKATAKAEETDWLLWLGVSLVLAIVLGGGYWKFNIRKKGKKGDGEDDDEDALDDDGEGDDDDDDAPGAKKKKGLAGLIARFKRKNKKKAGDDDGEENENGEDG